MRQFKTILKITVSLLLLWIVFRRIDWPSIILIGKQIEFIWLIPLIGLFPLGIYISSLRWYLILQELEVEINLQNIFRIVWSSAFLNTCLPGSTGGDLYRFIYIRKCSSNKTVQITSSLIIDRFFGLVSLLAIGIFSLFLADPTTLKIFTNLNYSIHQNIKYISIIIFALVLLLSLGFKLLVSFNKVVAFIKNIISQICGIFYNIILIFNISLCSVFIHILTLSTSYFISRAIGLNIPFFDLAIFITILAIVITIPISVNGLGLREALLFGFLQLHGYKCGYSFGIKESALAYSLLGLTCDICRVLPGGIFLVLSKDRTISDLKS